MKIKTVLIEKYEKYVANLQWHIKTNKPFGTELTLINQRLRDFSEMLEDLKKL
jgi:hypothetical protein